MSGPLLRIVSAASVTLAGVLLGPVEAHACDYPCIDIADVKLGFAGPIPFADGAIALRATSLDNFFDPIRAPAAVTITVTPAQGGAAVPGEAVAIGTVELLVWRPSAPLQPLTEYTVHVAVDNGVFAGSFPCSEETFERKFSVSTSDVASVALTVPELMPSATLEVVPELQLDSMVCCDGALPQNYCFVDVLWLEGRCAAGLTHGKMAVTLAIDAAVVAAGAGQVGYFFDQVPFPPGADSATFDADAPVCGSLSAVHFKSGEVMAGPEECIGQEFAEGFGLHPRDPAPDLAACAGTPYTCAAVDDPNGYGPVWDGNECKAWPNGQDVPDMNPTGTGGEDESGSSSPSSGSASSSGGEPDDKGCACAAEQSVSAAAGSILALALLVWRRRTRP